MKAPFGYAEYELIASCYLKHNTLLIQYSVIKRFLLNIKINYDL